MIKENLCIVQQNIEAAVKRSNRKQEEVTLIAVSKTKPLSMLAEAYNEGIRDFGENKVQEITQKWDDLPSDARFHMIGHLQTNKVKYIADRIYMIHSVDSVKLAEEISKQAVKVGRRIPILIEINIGNEDTKFGIAYDECLDFIYSIKDLPGIEVKGLMAIAPYTDVPDNNRAYFKRMRQLFVDITMKNIDNINMSVLSMGMSGDYEVAIEEGATYVRVGTGIFGSRDVSI